MKYKIIIAIILTVLLFIGLIFYSLIPRSYIKFLVAPNGVSVLINDKTYKVKNNDIIRVSPGKHTIKISQTDFTTYTEEIILIKNEERKLVVVLSPLTESALNLLKDPSIQHTIELFSANNRSSELSETRKNNPIIDILPISGKLYNISSCRSINNPNDTDKIALCIEHKQQTNIPDNELRLSILEVIKSKNYNPDDYEIIWLNDMYRD